MVGSPGQTVEDIVEDILFIERLRPEMIGIGPFLPHHDTPLPNAQVEQWHRQFSYYPSSA